MVFNWVVAYILIALFFQFSDIFKWLKTNETKEQKLSIMATEKRYGIKPMKAKTETEHNGD